MSDPTAPESDHPVLGFVLAGGLASRMGSPAAGKAGVVLDGRRLIDYPLDALAKSGIPGRVVAKRSSSLPDLEVEVIHEPEQPIHPLCGVVAALEATPAGASALVLGCDTPLVDESVIAALIAAGANSVAVSRIGRESIQPLIAHYSRDALVSLTASLADQGPLIAAVETLDPRRIELPILDNDGARPADAAFNVNSEADLAVATGLMQLRASD